MNTRRLLPLGLAVTVLLAFAGIASHGRPLSGGRGRGPSATFFDYVATTLVLFAILMLAVVTYAVLSQRFSGRTPRRGRWHLLSGFMSFAAALVLAYVLLHTGFFERLRHAEQQLGRRQRSGQTQGVNRPAARHVRDPRLRWDEIGIVVVLIAGTALVFAARYRTKRPLRAWRFSERSREVSFALDDSIDDLRSDPDLRRAIVAAYARTETALAHAGLPRNPSEAPFEYLERALTNLDTSSDSIRRLTGLFEWAKFSQHEPEPEMRDEAIDALVAVRDELRRPAAETITA